MMETPEGQKALKGDLTFSESSTLENFGLGGLADIGFTCKESAHGVITPKVLTHNGRSLDFVCTMLNKLQDTSADE